MPRVTIGILAHVDAGKTTLSEQILVHGGVRRSAGRVDHKDTLLDANEIERARGITIFSDQCAFTYKGRDFTLIDTPGHVDLSGETDRAIAALDLAVLIADASAPLRAHTKLLYRAARRANVPCVLFLNKCDLAAANPESTLESVREQLRLATVAAPFDAEEVAELDEAFLEQFLEGDASEADKNAALRRATRAGLALPTFSGSALRGEGVEALLDGLCLLTEDLGDASRQPLDARVYKVRRDAKGARMVYIKLNGGSLSARQTIQWQDEAEKINEVRRVMGAKSALIDKADAPDAVAVTGSARLHVGDVLTQNARGELIVTRRDRSGLRAVLATAVSAEDGTPQSRMLEVLRILEDEDPMLEIAHETRTNELLARVMGPVQVEILQEVLRTRFNIRASFSPMRVVYAETVAAPIVGYGHYEPLRHYAEAHIAIEPLPRGSGISFESRCHVDRLPLPYQKTIENALMETAHVGVLTGAALTDVKLVLTDGRGHLKHTEGGDFRQAARRAVRQALMRAENVLLEPYYAFEITVPSTAAGRVMSDLQAMSAAIEGSETAGASICIRGRGPVATLAEYPIALRALTHGEGGASMTADGYDLCHDRDAAIERAGYRAEADVDNPADSVFCAHGAGYNVPWREAEAHMHCLKN